MTDLDRKRVLEIMIESAQDPHVLWTLLNDYRGHVTRHSSVVGLPMEPAFPARFSVARWPVEVVIQIARVSVSEHVQRKLIQDKRLRVREALWEAGQLHKNVYVQAVVADPTILDNSKVTGSVRNWSLEDAVDVHRRMLNENADGWINSKHFENLVYSHAEAANLFLEDGAPFPILYDGIGPSQPQRHYARHLNLEQYATKLQPGQFAGLADHFREDRRYMQAYEMLMYGEPTLEDAKALCETTRGEIQVYSHRGRLAEGRPTRSPNFHRMEQFRTPDVLGLAPLRGDVAWHLLKHLEASELRALAIPGIEMTTEMLDYLLEHGSDTDVAEALIGADQLTPDNVATYVDRCLTAPFRPAEEDCWLEKKWAGGHVVRFADDKTLAMIRENVPVSKLTQLMVLLEPNPFLLRDGYTAESPMKGLLRGRYGEPDMEALDAALSTSDRATSDTFLRGLPDDNNFWYDHVFTQVTPALLVAGIASPERLRAKFNQAVNDWYGDDRNAGAQLVAQMLPTWEGPIRGLLDTVAALV